MSVSCPSFRSECDSEYAVDGRGSFEKISRQDCRPRYRRSGTAPGSVNGMHRRRQSRWTWGHGRGARISNLRAFAGCAILALSALCVSSASAEIISGIDFKPVNNKGNAANPSAPAAVTALGGGSVNYVFNMSTNEVSNTQYASFLNSVAKISDPNALFNASMQIARTGSAGNYSYSPTGSNGEKPVQFVSFGDTFRFANWLQNGRPTGLQTASTTENGVYNMTLSQPTRQAGAQFWIPSVNEWYKAAYYSPTLNSGTGGYYLYPVSSNTMIASAPPGGANSANFNNIVGTTVAAGSYVDAVSPYGLKSMAGNVAERLDTPIGSTYYAMQNSYVGAIGFASSSSASTFSSASIGGENVTTGFRVAAVPEPSTIVLAGMALASGAIAWARKRAARSGKQA